MIPLFFGPKQYFGKTVHSVNKLAFLMDNQFLPYKILVIEKEETIKNHIYQNISYI
jgi:hypothetical protein